MERNPYFARLSRVRTRKAGFLVALLLALAGLLVMGPVKGWDLLTPTTPTFANGLYTYTRADDPPRTMVSDANGVWVATFTDQAYTVALLGASRTFSETGAAAAVITSTWARVLDTPFTGTVDEPWLTAHLADTTPDILATAMQYITGTASIYSGSLQIAGDANYGPLVDGVRLEGSDFNDYLQIPWTYPDDGTDQPQITRALSLDCSGFARMVYGYRSGLPLTRVSTWGAIPRKAVQIYDSAPGVQVIPNAGTQVTDFGKLQAGDLVFFDASTDDGTVIDHVGLYLGVDTQGHYRFISSRKTNNGPTFADVGGRSTLDGSTSYLYVRSFRATRRL